MKWTQLRQVEVKRRGESSTRCQDLLFLVCVSMAVLGASLWAESTGHLSGTSATKVPAESVVGRSGQRDKLYTHPRLNATIASSRKSGRVGITEVDPQGLADSIGLRVGDAISQILIEGESEACSTFHSELLGRCLGKIRDRMNEKGQKGEKTDLKLTFRVRRFSLPDGFTRKVDDDYRIPRFAARYAVDSKGVQYFEHFDDSDSAFWLIEGRISRHSDRFFRPDPVRGGRRVPLNHEAMTVHAGKVIPSKISEMFWLLFAIPSTSSM